MRMRGRAVVGLIVSGSVLAGGYMSLRAQAPEKVDFGRDVQPIFRQNCYGCHGPRQQSNNLRLDRRKDAMRGGTLTVIGPGNSEASHLYLRLVGKDTIPGQTMPPTGALRPEQIATIKAPCGRTASPATFPRRSRIRRRRV